ncbi:P-loop containing nucleoside triphosphate hydrolase protein [Dichomitus squalens]|uniref:P-loop containing nucleoside triphosphate hydrolase protein n=1 Tax=Dichomitus squalens TaxID=114155 RepID=A0A4Q9MAM8_9APHY|nr:P-loop containing nucleoside triphosphate hydrolase protein [Dichomitus squalens]
MTSTPNHTLLLSTDYGKSSKELIEFVGELRSLGAHIDLELPRIVVIGNQSAGKSSLVEAISGISVPRDAGTCTRCPMECRLAYVPSEWSCQIKIRWEYDEKDKRYEEVSEVDFGALLTDKAKVEPMLRRAQAAVLNPHVLKDDFVDMSDEKLRAPKIAGRKPLLFSRNVVCVELAGPDLVDLSFVDLPGIVQNADAEIVKLVEDLVTSYIQGTSLILVTLPMSDDIENQKAARLAKLADPQGLRTIGVMTKPDMLTAGATKARSLWLEVLEGRRHPLRHGYYCTRQPDDDERTRGITTAEARAAESAFFQNTTPWCESTHRDRFGTTYLVQNISSLLTQIIRESLPVLIDQVATQLESCNAQLAKLPPAITTEPTAYVVELVTEFSTELAQSVRGSPTNTALVQSTRRIYGSFKHAIRSSAPPFVPYKDATHAPRDISKYVRVDAQDRSAGKKSFGNIMYLEDIREHISASITRELPGNEAFQHTLSKQIKKYFERYGNLMAIVKPLVSELVRQCAERTALQMRTVLQLETSPFTQNNHYLSECRDKWLAKYKDARAGKSAAERVNPAPSAPAHPIPFTFGAYCNLPMYLNSQSPSNALPAASTASKTGEKETKTVKANNNPTKKAATPTARQAKQQVRPQKDSSSSSDSSSDDEDEDEDEAQPVTQAGMKSSKAAHTFSFVPAATTRPAAPSMDGNEKRTLIRETLANLTKLGYHGLGEVDLGKLNPPDIYEEELQTRLLYSWIIDYIPLSIDHHFLYAFSVEVQRLLFERLGLGTVDAARRCSSYIAEDPTIVSTRDELTAKKKRLQSVQRALFNFGLQ